MTLASQLMTLGVGAGRLVVVRDTFTAPDQTGLPNADSGQAWTTVNGTFGISSDQAYIISAGGGNALAFLTTGLTTGNATWQISYPVVSTAGFMAFLFRYQDSQNYWEVTNTDSSGTLGNNVTLFKAVSNVFTSVATAAHTWANSDRISVTTSGASITVSINGAQIISTSDSALQSAKNVGLRGSYLNGRFDDLIVQSGAG